MIRPTYRFDLEPDPRIGSPRDLGHAIPAGQESTLLSVWVCHAGKRIADAIGHIYNRIVLSSFADSAEFHQTGISWYQVGRVSLVSRHTKLSEELPASQLSDGLRQSVAWFLWIGHDRAPKDEPGTPPQELYEEAQNLLPPDPVWSHHLVEILVERPGGRSPGERLFDFLGSDDAMDLQGWNPHWPARLVL